MYPTKSFVSSLSCSSLNLVLSSSCKEVPNIRNLFDSVGEITWFLGASGKRKRILQQFLVTEDIASLLVNEDSEELSDDFIQNSVKRCVPKLCETRWSARVVTLSSIISKYKAILHFKIYMLKLLMRILEVMPYLIPS